MLNVRTTYQRTLSSTDHAKIPSIPIAFAVYSPLLTEFDEPASTIHESPISESKGHESDDSDDASEGDHLTAPRLQRPRIRK